MENLRLRIRKMKKEMIRMKSKGLTISIVFNAESANYGEGIGNVTSLKKISRGKGDQYSYISRQALRYNIVNQMGEDRTPIGKDGNVLQFSKEAMIDDYPEIDLFGYMKTGKKDGTKTRAAVARLSNAISLETFKGDMDFLTNRGLLVRYNKENKDEKQPGGNISQSEIHRSYYAYTLTVDLDDVGIDDNYDLEIDNQSKSERVEKLLTSVEYLYRDIRGRREDLSPLFVIGGVYDIKNPLFYNALDLEDNKLKLERIDSLMSDKIKKDTEVGLVKGVFDNSEEIERKLGAVKVGDFFSNLKSKVRDYYEGD